MRINNNTWNKIRYTFYTPIYDVLAGIFHKSRKKSIDSLNIQPGDKVLIIGAGTGLDIKYIPDHCKITATDITPSMVDEIKKRSNRHQKNLQTQVMDGQHLEFENESFDIIILHLILAVIPDAHACIREADRVLKKDGKIAVFDKFIPAGSKPSLVREIINIFTTTLFSDITRDINNIVSSTSLTIVSDEPADFMGNFRLIQLRKKQ